MSFDSREQLNDPRAMRALAHPTRLAIIDVLVEGPATATECAARVGESPSTCSYHLRTLGRYGFAAESAESRRGRNRPWKLTKRDWWASAGTKEGPEYAAASTALRNEMARRGEELLDRYLEHESKFPDEWREATTFFGGTYFLTPKELKAVADQILGVLSPFKRPTRKERPADARSVQTQFRAFPKDIPS